MKMLHFYKKKKMVWQYVFKIFAKIHKNLQNIPKSKNSQNRKKMRIWLDF